MKLLSLTLCSLLAWWLELFILLPKYHNLDISTLLGCTPLHWAALRGNVEASSVLVQAGTKQELYVKDKAGFTPAQLASDKGHRHIAYFLVRISLYYKFSIDYCIFRGVNVDIR